MDLTEKIIKLFAPERATLYDFLKSRGVSIEKDSKEIKKLVNACVERVLAKLADDMLGDPRLYNVNVAIENALLKTKVAVLSRELECIKSGKPTITKILLKKKV
ncbi:MAG: hypothetical protein KKD44_28250 [Proteobacteria bacterium]|nr:hypothetical protein [Pseudomonadota bacterium]